MRRGQEVNFDPNKMTPGEWAVSLDSKYVRMCFSPGVCVRMATYDAFEADMVKIQRILSECEAIEEAVTRINDEISIKAQAVAEYTEQAKQYRDEAEQFRNQSFASTPEGYLGLVEQVEENTRKIEGGVGGVSNYEKLENKPSINGTELSGDKTLDDLGIASAEKVEEIETELQETTTKVNIIVENADLGFKETASGENIHLDDSADSKLAEFAIYGKATQDGTPTPTAPVDIKVAGESYNLLPYPYNETTSTESGVTWTDNNGIVTTKGTATAMNDFLFISSAKPQIFKKGTYHLSGCPSGGQLDKTYFLLLGKVVGGTASRITSDIGNGATFTLEEDTPIYLIGRVIQGVNADNLVFKPMIRKASVTNSRYMPYGVGSVEVTSLGKNYYDVNKTTSNSTALLMDISGNSIRLHNTSEATFVGTKFDLDTSKIKLGKTYTFGADVNYTSGSGRLVLRTKSGSIKSGTSILKTSGRYSFSFVMQDVGDYLTLFCTGSTAELGDVTYSNIQLEESGSITEYEPYKEKVSTIPTPNGIAGIKVDSGGNYTDENGQQWICDEIVKYADGSGEYVKKIGKIIFNGTETWGKSSNTSNNTYYTNVLDALKVSNTNVASGMISNRFIERPYSNHGDVACCSYGNPNNSKAELRISTGLSSSLTTVEAFKEWLSNNHTTVIYILSAPVITPLTPEQIAEIEKLKTFYPITNISNDFDCGMKVKYIADAKSYIDNRLALIEQAMLNSI